MNLRGWGNAFAVAGLILAIGVAIAQAPEGSIRYPVVIGLAEICALIAVVLLRPKSDERLATRVAFLRHQTSARDIAFLRAGAQSISFPSTLSRNAIALAPRGEHWDEESGSEADTRAQRLLLLGLLEPRGSEVETSALGRALLAFDDLRRIQAENGP